jgi:hypothetical protein
MTGFKRKGDNEAADMTPNEAEEIAVNGNGHFAA